MKRAMVEARSDQMQAQMKERLRELQLEHRDLDAALEREPVLQRS